MRPTIALVLLFAAANASANPFPGGDAKTGQRLFEQHRCNGCHVKLVGGDGSAIFTRTDSKVRDAAGLLGQMDACSGNIGAALTSQDRQHLGAYLNRYYNLR